MANTMDFSKLFTYVQYLRLKEDKKIISEKLNKNKEELRIGSNWDKLKIEFNNFRKSIVSSAGNYENKNIDIDKEIEKFNQTNKEVLTEPEANEQLFILSNENNSIAKLMFNINIALDKEYKYTYLDEGLKVVSDFINRNEDEIINVKKESERYYRAIADKSLSTTQKGILAGVAIASLAAVILIPVAAAGSIHAGATAGVAAMGFGNMQLGVGMLAFSGAILGTALVGGTYLAMKEYNENTIKEEFRKLNADEVALQFAINSYIIRYLKEKLKPEEFKERLDAILKEINLLKSDLDYYLFVEKNEVEMNKNKLQVFYGFDKVLIDILEIK